LASALLRAFDLEVLDKDGEKIEHSRGEIGGYRGGCQSWDLSGYRGGVCCGVRDECSSGDRGGVTGVGYRTGGSIGNHGISLRFPSEDIFTFHIYN